MNAEPTVIPFDDASPFDWVDWALDNDFEIIPLWGVKFDLARGELICACPPPWPLKHAPGKHPNGRLVPSWRTRKVDNQLATIERWQREPFINLGLIPPPDGVDLDIDNPALWEQWLDEQAIEKPGPTFAVATGRPGGGFHLYFRVAPGAKVPENAAFPWGETRTGRTRGYTVGPGSLHIEGRRYAVVDNADIAELPPGVLTAISAAPMRPSSRATGPGPTIRLSGATCLTCGTLWPSYPDGTRHDAIFRLTARHHRQKISLDESWRHVVDDLAPRFNPPYAGGEAELRAEFDEATKPERLRALDDWTPESARATNGDRGTNSDEALAPAPAPAIDEDALVAVNVSTMARPEDVDDWLVTGLIRPGAMVVVASVEGVGKSRLRKEIEVRLAAGIGPIFGYFPVPAAARVLTFDEENGEAEEWRRDEETLAALGLTRADLGDRYHRISFSGELLTDEPSQRRIGRLIEQVRPDVVFFDTGGHMIEGDEWGTPLKRATRFLKRLTPAVVALVHLTKPSENGEGKPGPVHGTRITDVMGHWTKPADGALLARDVGDDRIRVETFKRIPHADLILERLPGQFRVVAGAQPVTLSVGPSTAKLKAVDRVGQAIAAGITDPERIRGALGEPGEPLSRSTFTDAVARLREDGLVDPKRVPYELTEAGRDAYE